MAARTAVVAGTAQAVAGRVATNQQRKAQAQLDEEQYARAQEQARYASAAPVAAPAPVNAQPEAGNDSMLGQLQQLAEMKQSGLLTDQEFAEAKAKLLN